MGYKDYGLIISNQVKNQYGSSKKSQASYLAEKVVELIGIAIKFKTSYQSFSPWQKSVKLIV
ncbi:predicted protein [Histoplasma mississippiense (nom. inval.)]|uniref:predicted protein n=1 Tax=Ajellomyces capsulatus (strain NAm1 / WU24) TaxID=2059318 RepID=UPI000157CA23|nr:predicted protein [Histoplasma mississippiense (nom. inval.)]EDN09732.1 predicted protein [Histoplasma mississippiense (nom. inval.)]